MVFLDTCLVSVPCPYSNCTCRNCPFSLQHLLLWEKNHRLAVSSNLIISSDLSFYDLK